VACRAIPGSSRGGRPSLAPRSQVDARFDGRGAHQIDYARDVARGSPTIGWAAKNAGSYSTDEQRLGAGCIGGRKHPAALRKEREMSTWRLKSPQPTPGTGKVARRLVLAAKTVGGILSYSLALVSAQFYRVPSVTLCPGAFMLSIPKNRADSTAGAAPFRIVRIAGSPASDPPLFPGACGVAQETGAVEEHRRQEE
jgi:hypothetical protein